MRETSPIYRKEAIKTNYLGKGGNSSEGVEYPKVKS